MLKGSYNLLGHNGQTALMKACCTMIQHTPLLNIIEMLKCSSNIQDKDGKTALMYFIQYHYYDFDTLKSGFRLLKDTVNIYDKCGDNAIHYLFRYIHDKEKLVEIMKILNE